MVCFIHFYTFFLEYVTCILRCINRIIPVKISYITRNHTCHVLPQCRGSSQVSKMYGIHIMLTLDIRAYIYTVNIMFMFCYLNSKILDKDISCIQSTNMIIHTFPYYFLRRVICSLHPHLYPKCNIIYLVQ